MVLASPLLNKNDEWYTDSRYIEAARKVMGSIDLDPASCAEANTRVKATRYYTKADDGLAHEWSGNVWLNPPFGKIDGKSTIKLFIRKLLDEYERGHVSQAIYLITGKNNSVWFRWIWDYPVCFPHEHVYFRRPDGSVKDQMFGVLFAYLGPNEQRFIDVFQQFGTVAKRVSTPYVSPPTLF